MKTKSLLLCLMMFALLTTSAMSNTAENRAQLFVITEFPEDSVFKFVEKSPEFPGGGTVMLQYISQNFQIPSSLRENLPQGRVVLQFVVLKSGEISNIEVLHSFDSEFDKEAVRVVESMPLWIPGERNGEIVNAEYTLQIRTDQYFAPQFLGGDLALHQYLLENIEYSPESDKKGIPEGRMILQFNVLKSGEIDSIKVISGIAPILDTEVVRVIEAMPNWIPAKQQGKSTDTQHIILLPINFQLVWSNESIDSGSQKTDYRQEEIRPGDFIFPVFFKHPEFPGGNTAMMQWLSKNMSYPITAQEDRVQGRVICSFVVEKDGSISDVEVINSVHPILDAAAVSTIMKMPLWSPGTQNGKPARVRITMPIVYRLQESVVPTGRTSRTFFR
ncbi:MAG: energy transducer TonB [Dysgonamonadaceae bacterium]|nr:energy transducer TonB [Dysgonamonadaceae bacterium]